MIAHGIMRGLHGLRFAHNLSAYPQRAPLAPIRLRIGVHTGEVQLRDEANYVGPTINRTARLRDLAHGGQTVLSGTTEAMVIDQLRDGAFLREGVPDGAGQVQGYVPRRG